MTTYNEMHFLPYSLPCLLNVCDEVIVLDKSIDNSKQWLKSQNRVTVYNEEDYAYRLTYKDRRQELLNLGRSHEGTHFITIDADEIISDVLASDLKRVMKTLHDYAGAGCRWKHMKNLNEVYLDFDTSTQGIAFFDDGTNYNGNVYVHEDKLPYGFPIENDSFTFLNGSLFHFGAMNKKFVDDKWIYYMCCEFEEGQTLEFLNLKYCKNNRLEKSKPNTENFPSCVDAEILNVPYNISAEKKITDYILINRYKLNYLYKLNIWDPNIIKFCEEHIQEFDKSKLMYLRGKTDKFMYVLWRQFIRLLKDREINRILIHVYRYILYRFK